MWLEFRKQFPVTAQYAYFNNAGVAPISAPAAARLRWYLEEASSHGAAHYECFNAHYVSARDAFARLIGADPSEVAAIANTSDGLSLVANGLDWQVGDRVVVPENEFPANVYPWLNLTRRGVEIVRVPYVDGRCQPEHLAPYLTGARLLSLSAVSFANGFRFDLQAIGELCARAGVLFCVDGIQALGAFPLNVHACQIDFLAADGHKWLVSPEGAGFFFIRRERMALLRPSKIGWRNVRNDLAFSTIDFTFKDDAGRYEEGTPNIAGLAALGASLDLLLQTGIEAIAARILELTDVLVRELVDRGYRVVSPRDRGAASGIVSFTGADGRDLERLAALRKRDVILAHRAGYLRASPHAYNDASDIERLVRALAEMAPASQTAAAWPKDE